MKPVPRAFYVAKLSLCVCQQLLRYNTTPDTTSVMLKIACAYKTKKDLPEPIAILIDRKVKLKFVRIFPIGKCFFFHMKPRKTKNKKTVDIWYQEPVTRSMQLPLIPVTAFSQTELFLV